MHYRRLLVTIVEDKSFVIEGMDDDPIRLSVPLATTSDLVQLGGLVVKLLAECIEGRKELDAFCQGYL